MTQESDREGTTQQVPTVADLASALRAAGSAHHEYEQTALNGVYDEQWPMFYAAFVLGRLGEFTRPSALTTWLEESPRDGVWADDAARHVADRLGP